MLCFLPSMVFSSVSRQRIFLRSLSGRQKRTIFNRLVRFFGLKTALWQQNKGVQIHSVCDEPGGGCAGKIFPIGGAEPGRWSEQHQRRKQFTGKSCRPWRAYGYDDTCAGYTSQSRAPRHKNGGRHKILWSGLARRRLARLWQTFVKYRFRMMCHADFVVKCVSPWDAIFYVRKC